jgi:outer membrane protein TolC
MAMTGNRSSWITAAALTLAGVTAPAHAQQLTEARIKELVRQATDRVASSSTTLQTPAAAAQTATRIVPLTLDDAVKAALNNNLDIAVQRLNPEISDISYASLRAVYLPSLTSQIFTQSQTNASTSTITGGANAGAPIGTGLTTAKVGIAPSMK